MASPYTLCGLLLSLATSCLAYKIGESHWISVHRLVAELWLDSCLLVLRFCHIEHFMYVLYLCAMGPTKTLLLVLVEVAGILEKEINRFILWCSGFISFTMLVHSNTCYIESCLWCRGYLALLWVYCPELISQPGEMMTSIPSCSSFLFHLVD